MRRSATSPLPPPPSPNTPDAAGKPPRSDMATLKTLIPYLWVYKWRVLAALLCLIGAKLANVGVPVVLKKLVDEMTISPSHPHALLVLPLGALRLGQLTATPEKIEAMDEAA
eukprot:gene3350-4313_t